MRNFTCTFFFALLFFVTARSQSIVAGQYGGYDHFVDPPDVAIYVPGIQQATVFYPVDINGDQVDDIQLAVYHNNQGNWGDFRNIYVTPYGSNEIAGSGIDSCFGNDSASTFAYSILLANPFSAGNTIDQNGLWTDTAACLMKHGHDCCYPTPSGNTCAFLPFYTTPAYLGVRVVVAPDTFYGWLRLRSSSSYMYYSDTLFLEAYACQRSLVGMEEPTVTFAPELFPVPAGDHVNVQLRGPATAGTVLQLCNSLGQVVLLQPVVAGSTTFSVSTADLPEGVYHCLLLSPGAAVPGTRFVIAR